MTHAAIPTKYNGIMFRSRLEAKWARMFDMLGWQWEYEPVEFNGWIPDFALYGDTLVYVEIKPIAAFCEETARKIGLSGVEDEVLLLGQRIDTGTEDNCWDGLSPGWLAEIRDDGEMLWGPALFGRYCYGGGFDFCHAYYWFKGRISGDYTGNPVTEGGDDLREMWAAATNGTQWFPPKNRRRYI